MSTSWGYEPTYLSLLLHQIFHFSRILRYSYLYWAAGISTRNSSNQELWPEVCQEFDNWPLINACQHLEGMKPFFTYLKSAKNTFVPHFMRGMIKERTVLRKHSSQKLIKLLEKITTIWSNYGIQLPLTRSNCVKRKIVKNYFHAYHNCSNSASLSDVWATFCYFGKLT